MITQLINEMALQRLYTDDEELKSLSDDEIKRIISSEFRKTIPNYKLIKLILDTHSDIVDYVITPVLRNMFESRHFEPKLIKLLFPKYIEINKVFNSFSRKTILHGVICCPEISSLNMIKYLLDNDADPYIKDLYNDTPVLSLLRDPYWSNWTSDVSLCIKKIELLLLYNIDLCKNARISPTVLYLYFINEVPKPSLSKQRNEFIELYYLLKSNDRMFANINPEAPVGSQNGLPGDAYFGYRYLFDK